MSKFALQQIQKMSPYCPPLSGRREYAGLLLDFNERTIPVAEKVYQSIRDFLAEGKIQVYPEYGNICERIANYAGVKNDEVMITNGSDQGIDLIFRTFTQKGDKVIIPSPSFAMFYQSAGVVGNKIFMPSYSEEMEFPLEEVLAEIDEGTKLVVICNPNNPTGTLVDLETIEKVLQKARKYGAIVYIDEAYYEFSTVSATKLIERYDNLIITRTFSKAFGLPSLRIGYVLANKEIIEEMLKVRGPYDINMVALVAVRAALENISEMDAYAEEVMKKAKPFVEEFFKKTGIRFFPSGANFILFEENEEINFEKLKTEGVLIRPRGKNLARITIGTFPQMQKFLNQNQK